MLAPAFLPKFRIVAFLLEHAPQIVIRTAAELRILSIIILAAASKQHCFDPGSWSIPSIMILAAASWSLLDNVFWIQLMLNVIINTMGQAKPDS